MRMFAVMFLSVLQLPRSCATSPPAPVGPALQSSDAWFLSGGGRDAYTLTPDPAVPFDGQATTALSPDGPTDNAYGTAMLSIDAAPYRGQRLRVSAPVRTEGVTARGDFWVRAQAPWSPGDGPGLGGGKRKLEHTADFATYDAVFRVPQAAVRIEVGTGIAGPGRLWVGPASWEVVGEPAVPDSPVGVWNVTWDRSGTGWKPQLFHGTLVLGTDAVGLDWTESVGEPIVRAYSLEGARFRLKLGWNSDATAVTLLEGIVDGEELTGTVTNQGTRGNIPSSPLRGHRVPTLQSSP